MAAEKKLVVLKECSEGHLTHYRLQSGRFATEEEALKHLGENDCRGRFFIGEFTTCVDLTERKVVDTTVVPVDEALGKPLPKPPTIEAAPGGMGSGSTSSEPTTDPSGHSIEVVDEPEPLPTDLPGTETGPIVEKMTREIPQGGHEAFPELPSGSTPAPEALPDPLAVTAPAPGPEPSIPPAVEVDLSVPPSAAVVQPGTKRAKLVPPSKW